MLNKIIEFSIKNKLIVALFTLALIGVGIYETTRLPIDAVPDITNNQVQIITIAPSFGATDIERLVTFPIEQANSNISGIKEIRSFSRFGLSLVTIVFEDDVNIFLARQQVSERLRSVQSQIPEGIGVPELGPISTGLGEIYQYVLRPKKGYEEKYDAMELRTLQDWIVRRQLLGVKGVAEVSSFGGKLKQFEIAVSPDKLNSYGLTISDLFQALQQNNQNTGGAYIEKGPTALFIRSEGLIGSKEDIAGITVKTLPSGAPILVKDVAEINIGYATRYGAMCYNDEGEVAGAVVMMLKGANSSEVIKAVKARIEIIQKNLPEGVVIEPFLDRTKMVNNAIGTVEKNLIEGALIVIFILVLMLGNFRAGFLVASVIPLSMLFAIILMNMFGVSGNLMSLGALDFGLIVDGAVIIVEAVMHQLKHSHQFGAVAKISQEEMNDQVQKSAGKMMNSAVFGQIIILVVYLPIFTLEGIEGKMFRPMAQTVAFALIGAFVLSLTYIPMMSSLVLSKNLTNKPNFSDKIMAWQEARFEKSLAVILKNSKKVLMVILSLFVLMVITFGFLGGEFIPALEEGDFAVDTRVLTGSNLNTTIESTQKAASILKNNFPEVTKVVTKIGSGEVPTDPMPMEASDMMVILKDKSEWTSAKTFPELAEKMSKALEDVPGITTGFQYPVQMRFNELMTGARQDVVCKIFGEDLDSLSFYAQKLGAIVNSVEGAQDLYIEPVVGMPQIVIDYDRQAIAQYDLTIAEINRIVNCAFAGQATGMVYEGEKRFDLVVRLDDKLKSNIEDIRNLLIPTPNAGQIALRELAQVEIKNGPNQIQREDTKRRIVVGFNVRGRDVQSIVEDVQAKVDKQLKFPAGYYVTYGGAFENLNKAKNRLMIAVPISLALIFILLFFAFQSVKQSLLIYTAIPLSAIGGILFLALRGMPFSISASIGLIALFGVAVLNGIVLITEFNKIKLSGEKDLSKIVLKGTKVRLRPVLMTALVASLGFLPMAISNGAGAEVQRPLATVVIGGLMIATFLTLYVLPILYILFEKVEIGKIKSVKKIISLLTMLVLTFTVNAQSYSVDEVVEMAWKNSAQLQKSDLNLKQKLALSKSGFDLPKTSILTESGQINSNLSDTKISISQNFSFPTFYAAQSKVLKQEVKSASLHYEVTKNELRKTVSEICFAIFTLKEKEQLLKHADSLFQTMNKSFALRLEKGDIAIIEKSLGESQQAILMNQLVDVQNQLARLNAQLQLLTKSDIPLSVSSSTNRMPLLSLADSSSVDSNPLLLAYRQGEEISKSVLKLEKSKLLPDLNVGYFRQSIRTPLDPSTIGASQLRYDGFQVGVSIPLFFGSQRAKISGAKTQLMLAKTEFELKKMEMQNELALLLNSRKRVDAMVNAFEQTQLINSRLMMKAANAQYSSGAIDFSEWIILHNQALQLNFSYLDALNKLNELTIQINYYTSK